MKNKPTSHPVIQFNQFGSNTGKDELIMFAAPAKQLAAWAGIPRKGWHIRMLFQRPITAGRETDLKRFWSLAAKPDSQGNYILGPTSIVVALQGDMPAVKDGKIDLSYVPPVDLLGDSALVVKQLAEKLLPSVLARLKTEQREVLQDREGNPYSQFPEVDNDYVFEFALQLQQMIFDSGRFFDQNEIDAASQAQIIQSIEAVLRPAIVVDGQHRLSGAASVDDDVMLPVVAIPNCNWTEQIYQFVVINEKAQKVEPSMLTDIFGSSLTAGEQRSIRDKLVKSGVEIEARISAVVASRTIGNPFENIIVFKMAGPKPLGVNPYLSEKTIRHLIDGSNPKFGKGWRNDEDFYRHYVQPTIPNRDEWDSWASGKWASYWYAFWECVRDYYNAGAASEEKEPMWSAVKQSNLTKAVTLRQLQSLFMQFCIEEMVKVDQSRKVLIDVLKDYELVDQKLDEQRRERALPSSIDDFKKFVREVFLERGVPLKFFTARWKTSLDDPQGQSELWEALNKAFEKAQNGECFHIFGQIFLPRDE